MPRILSIPSPLSTPPKLEPIWASNSWIFLALNILTIGIYGAAEALSKQHRIKELKFVQEDLQSQVAKLINEWAVLETHLTVLLGDLNQGSTKEIRCLEENLTTLSSRKKELETQSILADQSKHTSFSEVALGTIAFVGQWFANFITVGFYGTYKYYTLKNRITILEAQRKSTEKQFNEQREEKFNQLQKIIDCASENIRLKQENSKVQQTTVGNEDQRAQKAEYTLEKLQTEVGPIPRKYTPRQDDQEIAGAVGITDIKGIPNGSWSAYANRYNGKRTAGEVVKAAFKFGFDELLKMSQVKDSKLHFSNCAEMQGAPGAQALYRFMVLDLIKGAKLDHSSCEGYELVINNKDVRMVPSLPEKVLRRKYDPFEKKLTPILEIHFTNRDDFTATESQLKPTIANLGVDPISIKWILAQLGGAEKEHLFNLLMSQLIKDDNREYIGTKQFMSHQSDRRVQLVEKAYQLICEMAVAVEIKFAQNLFIECWEENLCLNNNESVFIKEEDRKIVIPQDNLVQTTRGPIVEWKLDLDVLGDKRSEASKPRQSDFATLISGSQEKYLKIFTATAIHPLLVYPESQKKLNGQSIHQHYHVAHLMIDRQATGGMGCLISNLLAILVTDKSQLTSDNAYKLLKAMAAYLDKLQQAKMQLVQVSRANQNREAGKLKELAELATNFEKAIHQTHRCSVQEYQAWLRQEVMGAARIDKNDLTPLEIQLCAYAIGVKIGVVRLDHQSKNSTQVNQSKRVIPEADYYGPCTDEFLLIGAQSSEKGGTYCSLYPRLSPDIKKTQVDPELYKHLIEVENYWNKIGT